MSVNQPIFSVTELTQKIKQTLEGRFERIQVKGEVSNLRHQASGHLYFTLKDQGAQLSAVLFRGDASLLKGGLPRDGDQLIAQGELSIYPPRGQYQLIVRKIEQTGLGELLLALHALKKKLASLGYFESKGKKPLPKYPQTIGVVTSPTGAVIRDIIHVLARRFKPFSLLLNPVRVQGESAAEEIAQAIDDFNRFRLADLLIVGRGGGSLEDLLPFNDERVAKAIFNSNIPIISAVGHETDVSIADLVADCRAPTPSAAGEMAVREYAAQTTFLQQVRVRVAQNLKQVIARCRAELKGMTRHPLFASSTALLAFYFQKFDVMIEATDETFHKGLTDRKTKLEAIRQQLKAFEPSYKIRASRAQLTFFSEKLDQRWAHQLGNLKEKLATKGDLSTLFRLVERHMRAKRERLKQLTSHLTSIDPKALLKKGYCIPFAEKDHSVIMSVRALSKMSRLSLLFHDGSASVVTDEVKRDD